MTRARRDGARLVLEDPVSHREISFERQGCDLVILAEDRDRFVTMFGRGADAAALSAWLAETWADLVERTAPSRVTYECATCRVTIAMPAEGPPDDWSPKCPSCLVRMGRAEASSRALVAASTEDVIARPLGSHRPGELCAAIVSPLAASPRPLEVRHDPSKCRVTVVLGGGGVTATVSAPPSSSHADVLRALLREAEDNGWERARVEALRVALEAMGGA